MSPYILLGFFIAGLLHVFVNPSTLTRHLAGNGLMPVVKAALIGIPLPLCSCGVLPTAVSLRRQGASKAATTSFLIATPQTGVDSIAATYSLLGWAFAIIRPIAALVGAVFGGVAVGKFAPDKQEPQSRRVAEEEWRRELSARRKFLVAMKYGFGDMIDSMGKWLVIGLVIAALITVFVPDSIFVGLSEYPLLAMLAVVIVAIPMYICATGSIPIAMSLMLKGLSPGIAFVMLMAGPAANFASMVILTRTQGKKATMIYVASVVVTSIMIGLIIDCLLPREWFALPSAQTIENCHLNLDWFSSACSIALIIMLILSAIRMHGKKGCGCHNCGCEGDCHDDDCGNGDCGDDVCCSGSKSGEAKCSCHSNEKQDIMKKEYKVKGMNCAHCQASVEKAIKRVEGVETVVVNLSNGTATVTGNADPAKIIEAVTLAGFDVEE